MKRKDAISSLVSAGYHNDSATWSRVYIENRISYAVAKKAWGDGASAKKRGARCSCFECSNRSANA